MRAERFRAASVAEALVRVKDAFGADAVIVGVETDPAGVVVTASEPAAPARVADEARVEIVFGPPGEGKTTVLGKLAVAARRRGERVALVTTDTYRLGAGAELDALARVLAVPHARAVCERTLAAVLAELAPVGRVLVDTTGAGSAQAAILAEVGAFVAASGAGSRRTLVVAATSAPDVLAATLDAFQAVRPTACVVTKADLAPATAVTSQISRHGVVVSAVSSGRSLADLLVPMRVHGLARRLLAA